MIVSANWLAALRVYLLTTAGIDLIWETAHLPLYTLWQTGSAGANIFAVAHCTLGDVLIALASLTIALFLVGHRDWPTRRFARLPRSPWCSAAATQFWDCPNIGGIMPLRQKPCRHWRSGQIDARTRHQAYCCRLRSGPGAADRRHFATIASAATCSCVG